MVSADHLGAVPLDGAPGPTVPIAVAAVEAALAADSLGLGLAAVPAAVVAAFATVVAASPAITAAESLSPVAPEGGPAVRPRWPGPDSHRRSRPASLAARVPAERWQRL